MSVELSVAIMAHPSRKDRIPAIEKLLLPYAETRVELDENDEGPWAVAKRCWEGTPENATHSMILQDDVLLCQDFYVGACRAIRHRPASPLAFYANSKSVDEAREQGRAWARVSGMWGVAQCLPAPYVKALLCWATNALNDPDYADNVDTHGIPGDDWFLSRFLKKAKLKTWATVPSLVEHGLPKNSLMGHRQVRKDQRVARWFIGENVSALSVDFRKRKPCLPTS